MPDEVDFAYQSATTVAGVLATVSVFHDNSRGRSQLIGDLEEAGFRVLNRGDVAQLLDGGFGLAGDVMILECMSVSAQSMAAMARLDLEIARSGVQLIVVTSLASLDDIFACFDQSIPQFLVAPSRADLIVAVGRGAAQISRGRVQELSQEDRAALVRLTQQVEQIARQLEGLSERNNGGEVEDRLLQDKKPAFRGFDEGEGADPLVRPSLPDPRIVRDIIRRRQARGRFFDPDLFADPAWDILLDLTASDAERVRVSVTSLCIASGVPATTALRWIRHLTAAGLLMRVEDTADKRRVFISLTDKGRGAMARYFADVVKPTAHFAAEKFRVCKIVRPELFSGTLPVALMRAASARARASIASGISPSSRIVSASPSKRA